MAAAQVAKKLKDRRQKQTLEEIFRKVCWYCWSSWRHNFSFELQTLIVIWLSGGQGWVRDNFSGRVFLNIWRARRENQQIRGWKVCLKSWNSFVCQRIRSFHLWNVGTVCRVHKLVGPDGLLKKDDFIKILQSSNFFMKTFDKNQDGIVTEVGQQRNLSFFQL